MRAREITQALDGRWHGTYGTAQCPAHDDRHASLSVTEREGRILVKCHAGCEQEDVIAALKAAGLWPSEDVEVDHHIKYRKPRARSTCPPANPNGKAALAIWTSARPAPGTSVETYLRARSITTPPPVSLRYHSALRHSPTGQDLPAMIAAVQGPDRKLTAVLRTFLTLDGTRKAPVRTPKLALGGIGAGAVRLARAGAVLGLAEGIETALSAMQLFDVGVWAALGSRMDQITLPTEVKELHIFADNGDPGHAAANKAAAANHRRRVVLHFPPDGIGDWNDLLMSGGRTA